jgi:tetratricopeptide (TPR) repeat protein
MFRIIGSSARKQGLETAGCGFLSESEIESYLEGRLASARQVRFSAHQMDCSSCALVAADLENFSSVQNGSILENERREFNQTAAIFKAQLREELETHDTKRRPVTSFFKFSWNTAATLAAAALLLVAITIQLRPGNGNVIVFSNGERFAVQAMPFSQAPITRGSSVSDLWENAGAAYQAGDYDGAAGIFGEIGELDAQNHDAALYRGISLLMTGEYHQALMPLRRAARIAEGQGFSGTAHYFLGLAALGLHDHDLAMSSLEQARDLGGRYEQQINDRLDWLMQLDVD